MNTFKNIWLKLRPLGHRRVVKQEIDEELRFHIEQRTAENIAHCRKPARSLVPGKSKLLFCPQPPHREAGRPDPNHGTHSFGVRVERPVTEKSADEVSRLVLSSLQQDQTIPRMAQRGLTKVQIAREKGRCGKCNEKGKYLLGQRVSAPHAPRIQNTSASHNICKTN